MGQQSDFVTMFGAESKADWNVKDGAIRVSSGEPGLLRTTTQFADYELKADFRAAISFVSERFPDLPIWAAGMSFGSWIALTTGAADTRVSLLLGIAPPVDRYDFDALKTCTLPKFIIHGEEDELISIKEIRKFYAQLPEPKELVTIEDANHLFEGKTSLVGEAVEDLLADFNTVRT